MALIRLLLACLLMLSVPLQGFAAASMAFCGGSPGHQQQFSQSGGQHAHAQGEQDHSRHHDPQVTASASDVLSGDTGQLPDQAHKCGVCGACSHSVAIAEIAYPTLFATLPQVDPAEPVLLVDSRPALVPDKPPRG